MAQPTSLTIQNAQNMSLTYVTLFASLNEVALQELFEERQEQFVHQWNVLKDLAFAGQEQSLDLALQTALNGWAIKRGIEVLLDKKKQGMTIDPTSQTLIHMFLVECNHQYHVLSHEILLFLQKGKEQRLLMQEQRARDWQGIAYQSSETQQKQKQNQQWQGAAIQWVQDQQNLNQQWVQNQQQLNQQWFQRDQVLLNQYQQANHQWAHVALNGVQQAQAGVQQNHEFAARIQQNVIGMLIGTEQRQVQQVQEALQKNETKKFRSRLKNLLLLALVICIFLWLFGTIGQSLLFR